MQEQILEQKIAKFDIQDLLPIGLTLVVLGIGLAYGLSVVADIRDDFTTGTAEYNASRDTVTAIAKIPDKLGLIVTIIVAAVIIGILLRYLFVRYGR